MQALYHSDSHKILIVEDDRINRRIIIKQLKMLGYEAQGVTNGQCAVDYLENNSVDLIFMDCQMPVMDGYTATTTIRDIEGDTKNIIIGLTAHAMPGDRQKCLDAGMDDYLAKPVFGENLQQAIQKWLSNNLEADSTKVDETVFNR